MFSVALIRVHLFGFDATELSHLVKWYNVLFDVLNNFISNTIN